MQAVIATLAICAASLLNAGAHAQSREKIAREKVPTVTPMRAALFPLEAVRLLPGPFRQVQETDRAYLLRLSGQKSGGYLYVIHPLPGLLTRGKAQVTVRLEPKPGSTAGGQFDLRVLRQP